MLEALRLDGQPEEAGWPYTMTPVDLTSWIAPVDVGPLFYRASQSSSLSIDELIRELDQARPVVVLMMLSRAFYAPNSQAVVDPAIGESPEPARRHAVVAVGHGTVDQQRAILIRNSWGLKWGEAGHAWLTERFLSPRIFASATLTGELNVPAHSSAA
jgi:hypothetical protein